MTISWAAASVIIAVIIFAFGVFWKLSNGRNKVKNNLEGNQAMVSELMDSQYSKCNPRFELMEKNQDKILGYFEGNGSPEKPGINALIYDHNEKLKKNEIDHEGIFERMKDAKI